MALEAQYKRFLAHPTAEALAANATLTYIPTVTTITAATGILKHIQVQDQQLQKRSEVVLHALESTNGLCLETETTLSFTNGGGVYLPNLDDHFFVGRTVTVVIIHIVTFNTSQQIERIRLLWDQGSLLKSIDIIGRSGRTWPIHPGTEQSRIVRSSTSEASQAAVGQTSLTQGEVKTSRPDDAVVELFSPRITDNMKSPSNPVAPRESAKPASREYEELFAPSKGSGPASPSKRAGRKSGAGKNFSANRLFDQEDSTPSKPATPSVKTNPNKFDHFDFTEPAPTLKTQAPKVSKLGAHWDFADFSTPPKATNRTQPHTTRNFDMANGQKALVTGTAQDQPKTLSRPDTSTHFEFEDITAHPAEVNTSKSQGGQTRAAGHYEAHLSNSTNDITTPAMKPDPTHGNVLGSITNTDQNRKTFDSHWEMTDDQAVIQKEISDENARHKIPSQAQQKAINLMQPTWQMYDESPPKARGIRIAGNGMGGRLDASEGLPEKKGIKISGNGMGGRMESIFMGDAEPESRGIRIAGNGMGGRRGTSTLWEF